MENVHWQWDRVEDSKQNGAAEKPVKPAEIEKV